MKGKLRKTVDWLKYHVVDTTSLLTISNPLYSLFETTISGMSDEVSINARVFVAKISYLGIGSLYARGRDLSRRIFKITKESSEKTQQIHDSLYSALFNTMFAPPVYMYSGADRKEVLIGGCVAALFGLVSGPLMGWGIDVGRDLTGLGKCERKTYPSFIKKRGKMIKKGLATASITASIGLMGLIYNLTPDEQIIPESQIEQVEVGKLEERLLEQSTI